MLTLFVVGKDSNFLRNMQEYGGIFTESKLCVVQIVDINVPAL